MPLAFPSCTLGQGISEDGTKWCRLTLKSLLLNFKFIIVVSLLFQDFSLKNLVRVLMFLCISEMSCYLMEEQKVTIQRFTKLVYRCYVQPHCMNLWCTTAKFHLGFKCMLLAGAHRFSFGLIYVPQNRFYSGK